jgi:TatD DNase family protein
MRMIHQNENHDFYLIQLFQTIIYSERVLEFCSDREPDGEAPPVLIDHHGHLSDSRLTPVLDALVSCLRQSGVTKVIMGGTTSEDWDRQLEIQSRYPDFAVPVFGIHPWTVASSNQDVLQSMYEELERKIPLAAYAGEVGLDFFRCETSEERSKQEYWCERQLTLARHLKKPVVIHCVRAHDRMLSLLKKTKITVGLVHGFTANENIGRQYLNLGLKLSIDGLDLTGPQRRKFAWLTRADYVLESDEPFDREDLSDPATLARRWVSHLRDEV